jgi:hypothetical protein
VDLQIRKSGQKERAFPISPERLLKSRVQTRCLHFDNFGSASPDQRIAFETYFLIGPTTI